MGAPRFAPVSQEAIATSIVSAAYTVHKYLGPGLLEKVYEACFCHELKKVGTSAVSGDSKSLLCTMA